jgi:tetratricopeptide (TPR) repeat protein
MSSVRQYLSLASDHPNAHDSYAEILQSQGRYPEALMHYTHAVERDGSFNQGYVGRAEVYHSIGDMQAAVDQMDLAIEHAISPGNEVTLLRQRASIQAQHGDRDAAMSSLGQAARVAADAGLANAEATVHRQMALTEAALGDGSSAQGHLDRAAELGSSDSPAHLVTTALTHLSTGNAQAAAEAAAAFVEATDNDEGARSWAMAVEAMTLTEGGDPEGALQALSRADASLPVVQVALSRAYEANGYPVAAERLREEARTIAPGVLANMFVMWAAVMVDQD